MYLSMYRDLCFVVNLIHRMLQHTRGKELQKYFDSNLHIYLPSPSNAFVIDIQTSHQNSFRLSYEVATLRLAFRIPVLASSKYLPTGHDQRTQLQDCDEEARPSRVRLEGP